MREMNRMVKALNDGEIEKYVLMKNGRMVAVVLDLDSYTKLIDNQII